MLFPAFTKVGIKYKGVRASTDTALAPTLDGVVPTQTPPQDCCVHKIVKDGQSLEAIDSATVAGFHAAALPRNTTLGVTAGNYGDNLGPIPIRLHEELDRYQKPN